MFSRIFRFGQKKQQKKALITDSDDYNWLENFQFEERGLPCLEQSQIRLLVYKDHDKRGDKLVLFDSKTVVQDEKSQNKEGSQLPRKRISSDSQLIGEMIFGSVEMTYKGPTVKAHSIRTPPQLLLTKVFALKPPRAHNGSLSHSSHHSNSSSELSSSVRFSESVSSVSSVTSPITSSDNEESSGYGNSLPVSCNMMMARQSFKLQNIAEGFSGSMSGAGRSLTFPRAASSSYQRRWWRSQVTRMDYGCMKRNDYFNEEISMRLRRRPKIGIGVLFSLWENNGSSNDNNRLFRNFVFSHFALFESHIHRLKRMVEKVLLSSVQMTGKCFQERMLHAANTFAANILDLYYAPRIKNPVWLTMLSQPEQCNTICEDLVPQIVNVIQTYNTKQTNYFFGSLLTAVLTYHVAWVTTVTPSCDVARRAYLDKHSSNTLNILSESHPYNPLWAQLSELYGACGEPTKMTRTVIIGEDHDVVTIILHVLSYFIRCSEVFEKPLEQSPCGLSPYLESSEKASSSKDIEKDIPAKCAEINEKSQEPIMERSLSSKEREGNQRNCTEPLSQNSKSFWRDAKLACHKKCFGENVSDCGKPSTNNCNADYIDSCGEDSGICSTDLESSVELVKTEVRQGNVAGQRHSDLENCDANTNAQKSENFNDEANPGISEKSEKENSHSNGINISKVLKDEKDFLPNMKNSVSNFVNRNSSSFDLEMSHVVDCESWEKCLKNCHDCLKHKATEENEEDLTLTVSHNHSDEKLRKDTVNESNCQSSIDNITCETNANICACNDVMHWDNKEHDVMHRDNKEHELWNNFLKTSFYNKNTRSLNGRYFSRKMSEEDIGSGCNLYRACSSKKTSDYVRASRKLYVDNDGTIVSMDQQKITDLFFNTYPFCPLCNGQLNSLHFIKETKVLADNTKACLCKNCGKIKSCSCKVIDNVLSKNERCASTTTINSDGYFSGSIHSYEVEKGSMSSVSIDSGLNEQCSHTMDNVNEECLNEPDAFMLSLPDTRLDKDITENDLLNKNSQDCQLFSFGRSLMAGYCDQYVPDFVLHGTDRLTDEQAKKSLQISLEQPVVDSPISESVIISGDVDKWECTIKTLPRQRRSVGSQSNGLRSKKAERSTLVHDFLCSFCDLWELNMPASFCLMHLEDKLKELYLRSKVVSEFLLTHKYVTMRDLVNTFSYGDADLSLIMSIIGVHSPQAISRLPLSSQEQR
ncbi:folliculin-interacting protein 2-like isoform X2 [Xenia sp. Carnegie-2017]|uniref:folliculin-interacting protein 2-like isoform X2 n=1 Tax=Xenia sp. Carnegie-2017 TaxID=2897299 RepID=UPI001F034185|nr:folliculin-interacting protein 2-like isoform X2 [Xenia sp. Carnegie-2017]